MRRDKGRLHGICLKCQIIHRPQHEALLAQLISDGSATGQRRTFCDTTGKVCGLVMVALQNEQLSLALVGGIQKFFDFVKALVGCRYRLFHEHVHNGVPPEVFNEALDGQYVMGAV